MSAHAARVAQRATSDLNPGGRPTHPVTRVRETLVEALVVVDDEADWLDYQARVLVAIASEYRQRASRLRCKVRPEIHAGYECAEHELAVA